MADSTVIFVGNIVHDLEGKRVGDKTVVNFAVAVQDGRDENATVSYVDVNAWGYLADHLVASMRKGDRVSITGRLRQDRWETPEGQKRSKLVVVADTAGVELRFATAKPVKAAHASAQPGNEKTPSRRTTWDEEPF